MNPQNSITTSLAIRKSISEVFQAFINPEITTKFWFTDSTASLTKHAKLNWTWSMYELTIPVKVLEIIENCSITIEWGEGEQNSKVKWEFKAIMNELTFVTITNYDIQGEGESLLASQLDSANGFTFVLSGLKAWLEYGIELNLVADVHPREMRS